MEYGQYSQNALEILAPESDFCFVLNGTESQGIAVQEIMSYNTPMFVWDIESWEDQGPEWSVPATSIPYWSDECGERFVNADDMEVTFDKFYSRIGEYNPRKYVEDNLSKVAISLSHKAELTLFAISIRSSDLAAVKIEFAFSTNSFAGYT